MLKILFLVFGLVAFLFANPKFLSDSQIRKIEDSLVGQISPLVNSYRVPTGTATPIPTAVKKKSPPLPQGTPAPLTDNEPWGVAKQIGEHTWTMKVANDVRMATPQEILQALNNYRQKNGSQSLSWDNTLAAYAQLRADYFVKINKTDAHQGFIEYLDKQDGYEKLGFNWLGENSSYGYQLLGVHLIEWIFAGDQPHNDNQLATRWDHVGIGINGTAVDIIFATSKR